MSHPLGDIFAEQIVKGQKQKNTARIKDDGGESLYHVRLLILAIIFVLGLGLLLVKLFALTVVEGKKYRQLSSGNRIRETTIVAPRGIIYDRKGIALTRNIPAFILPNGNIFYENVPATAAGEIRETNVRDYIFKEDLAHVIGFVGEANEEELKKNDLLPGDIVGKTGIEKSYDAILRGRDGKELIEVDALGRKVRVLGNVAAVAGKNITLNIDENLQQIARTELNGKKGAVVASDPKTGAILALYSAPSFDPNKVIRKEDVENLLNAPDQPFFDRAISGLYPPGSIFKPVIAVAALESGAIDENTKFEDTGILTVGQFSFANWYFTQYGKKEGMVDIVSAIKRSNDIFFYKTGEATGIETLASWAKKMGLGVISGIDVSGEAAGVMPDPAWRQNAKGTGWFLGDTYHVAIGQGDLQVTPLQANAWTNVIANNGKLCRPHLSNLGNLSDVCRDLKIKKETLNLIREGMREACATGGTGWPLFNFKVQSSKLKIDGIDFLETFESTTSAKSMVGIPTACKTGTAEFGDPKNRTHAWFTVFVPVYNPQISITVLVEEGGEGSNVAAPIAKKILEKWFGS